MRAGMRIPLALVAVSLAAVAGAASAATTLTAEPGAVQLNLPVSVRSLGMGWVTSGGTDVLRAWGNPAALVDCASRGEVALVGGAVLTDTQQFGLGGSWKLNPDWSVGVIAVRYGFSIDEIDAFGEPAGKKAEQAVMSESIMTAYRWRFLRAGIALKGVQETLLGIGNGGGALDAGLAATWMGITGSVAVRNLGTTLTKGDSAFAIPEQSMPVEVRAGLGYRLGAMPITGAVEFFKAVNRDPRFGLGVEYWAVPFLALRAGGILPGEAGQVTAGFSALWRQFSLDYAVALHSSGMNHRLAISYAFGEAPAATAAGEAPVARAEEPALAPAPAPAAAPAKGAKQLNLAVADLRAENVSAGNAAVIADLLRGELVKTHTFNVIEKANMDKVLAEQAFQQTGCSSEECAVKLGKLLNVQRMVVGSFGLLLDSYFLNVRVVDVETGRVSFGDSAEGKTVADLKVGVRDLAKRMASQIR